MSGFFVESGNNFTLTDDITTVVHPELPKGVYEIKFNPMRGYWMTRKTDVKPLPPKLYGSVVKRAERILQTYTLRQSRGLQTGVLLSGNKGSGKTLLASYLMQMAPLPTVLVTEPYADQDFMNLLAAGGPKLVLLDEFEKVYADTDRQAMLLSLLDGHYKTCNLTIATVNDRYKVHDAMKNRPSRFYYHYQYGSLDREFIKEYCKDKLKQYSPKLVDQIMHVVGKVWEFNFDMLQCLVEEINQYGDSPEDCMQHLNIVPDSMIFEFGVRLEDSAGKVVKIKTPVIQVHHPNPTHMEFHVQLAEVKKKVEDEEDEDSPDTVWFNGHHFECLNEKGEYVFKSREYKATLAAVKRNAAGF